MQTSTSIVGDTLMAIPDWRDKTVFTGDNLPIMRGMSAESADLIYLDPPFNSNASDAAPIGSVAAGAVFKDTWSLSDIDIAWLDLIESKHPALNRGQRDMIAKLAGLQVSYA